MQKYGLMANTAVAEPFSCEICGEAAGFNWSDYHGEGMCNRCGTPYQLVHYEGEGDDKKRVEKPPQLSIKTAWVLTLKRYWNETHAYMGLGQIFIWRDYPEAADGRQKFDAWLERHPDMVPKEESP